MSETELALDVLREEKIGLWRVEIGRRVFVFSNFLRDAVGIEENEVDFERFVQLVASPYRALLGNGDLADMSQFAYDLIFPLVGPRGEVWLRWKYLCSKNTPEGAVITGYAQQIVRSDQETKLVSMDRMNNLLYRLNSISHTLLSFLHTDSIDGAVNNVLLDILKMFRGSRAYITEFDWERRVHVPAYEVTDQGVESGYDEVNALSIDDTPWWMERLLQGNPIILSDLNDLPPEALSERDILAAQGIRALFVIPLMIRDKLWGYAGIDIVGEARMWHQEDYQWFASLVNIVNLCIGLQRSEREAQTERDYLQSLYRYMPMGYMRLKILYDRVGVPVNYVVLDTNYAADAIIGLPHADFIGRTGLEMGWKLDDYLSSIVQTLHTEHYVEKDTYTHSGKYIHSIFYSTQQDEVTCLFSDTTEVHTTHDALDRNEKLLRDIYDNIPVGIEMYDKNGLLVDINNKDMDIFGVRSKEEVRQVNFFDNPIIPKDIRERVRQQEEFTFRLDYPFNQLGSYYQSSKTGHIEIYTSVSMLYNAQGQLDNFMLINIDNTEINRAHSRIAEFESSFSLVSRFGKIGYCRFDLLSKEGYAMPQWYHNLGEKEDTPLNQVIGVYTYIDPLDRESIFESICRIEAGETDGFSHDLHVTVAGESRWTRINVMCNPLNNDPSKIEMVCVNYDVTELKETEQNLIEAKNKAEVSDRLKSAFLANMSHEIRTPLNAIVGFSNLIMETENAGERREYMTIVQENNDLLLKLISDILDLSKIEAGTLDFNNSELDVNAMCQEIVRASSIKLGNKPVELRFGEHLPECRLISDKSRLTQVLTNFINNALKFTHQGSITLSYRCDDDKTLRFYVEDTGSGIPDHDQAAVFDRFIKLNAFVQGTGLGLAISKSIVEQLGGTIGLTSKEGQGSCFWFTHPYIKMESKRVGKQKCEKELPVVLNGSRPVILIAEDTDSNFLLLSLLLKEEYEILRAHNGAEAVSLSRKMRPDLILMDMKMPMMDGLEATRCIRVENGVVPIIAITAFAYDQDRQKMLDAGCNDYMSKPISRDVLKQKLHHFLKQ